MVKLLESNKLKQQWIIAVLLVISSMGGILLLINWRKIQASSQVEDACTIQPTGALTSDKILATKQLPDYPKESTSVRLEAGQLIGYSFSAKNGQVLGYSSKYDSCKWLFSLKERKYIPFDSSLESGEYVLHVSTRSGDRIANFSFSMWLESKQLVTKPKNVSSPNKSIDPAIQPSPVKEESPSKQNTAFETSINDLAISWFKNIGLNALINIGCSVAVMFFVGSRLKTFKEHIRGFTERRETKDLKLFWFGSNLSKSESSELPKYHIVYGSTPNPGFEDSTSNEYSKAKNLIVKFLEGMGCVVDEHVLLPNENLNHEIFDGNVVLLTGEAHPILGFDEFVESIKLPYFYTKSNENTMKLFRRVRNFSGDQIEYRQASVMDADKNTVCLAFGTLTRLADPDTDRVMIILNGGHGFGVSAPAYFLTSYDRRVSNLNYLDFSKLNREIHSYQIVLEVNNSKKQKKPNSSSRDLHLSTWVRLEVGRNDLNSAITDLCKGGIVSSQNASVTNNQNFIDYS